MLTIRQKLELYWPVLALFTGYLLALAILAAYHHFIFFSEGIFIPLFFLIAYLSRRTKAFINDWAIYLAILLLLNALRGLNFSLVNYWQLHLYSNFLINLEKFVTFGHIVPHLAQQFFFRNNVISVTDDLFAMLYGSHFLIFIFFGLFLWFSNQPDFWRYKLAFILITLIALIFFLIFPTMPPWLASEHNLIPKVVPLTADIYNMSTPTLFNFFNSNPVAAMPSLHAGFATLCFLIGVHHFHKKALFLIVYVLLVYSACLILGAHYLVDLLAGSLLAIFVYLIVYKTEWFQILAPRIINHPTNYYIIIKIVFAFLILYLTLVISVLSSYLLTKSHLIPL